MGFDLIQAVIYAIGAIISSAIGGGGVLVYVRRHFDLRYEERLADLEDRKSDNETFAGVVKTFHEFIVNSSEVAKERNRIQAEMATDNRKFMAESIETLTDLRNTIVKTGNDQAKASSEIKAAQERHGTVLEQLVDEQKATRADTKKLVQGVAELRAIVKETLGVDSLERTRILQLLEQLVSQATDELQEKKEDPEAAAKKPVEGSQKESSGA